MRRPQPLWLAAFLLLAATTQAATLRLPSSPGATAVVYIEPDAGPDIPLTIPPDYPLDGTPAFGKSGDIDSDFALIGAPEAWGEGVAFVYDTQTGDFVSQLRSPFFLNGGRSRAQLGHDVLLWQGLAVVAAPMAGDGEYGFGPGAVLVFNPTTGQHLQTIWGPDTHHNTGQSVYSDGQSAYVTGYNRLTGLAEALPLAIIPEPASVWLAALGLLAARSPRPRRYSSRG